MSQAFRNGFSASLGDAAIQLDRFRNDEETLNRLAEIAERLETTFKSGGKALIAGNGGSMADAMHFAEEWTGNFRKARRPFPVLVLGSDPTHLTCVGNDYGFEAIFARSVEAFATPGDILFLLSTSGNSENLIQAAEAAKRIGAFTVGFLGKGGGRLGSLCDLSIVAPGDTSDRIQELHMLSLHILIEVVERGLGLA